MYEQSMLYLFGKYFSLTWDLAVSVTPLRTIRLGFRNYRYMLQV